MIEMVSKEFRAPLTSIRGATRALERQGMVPDAAQPLLAGLESGTQRLVDLVAAVSAVLETEDATGPMRIDTFSVKSLLRRVVDHLGVRDPGARVTFAIEPTALTCRTDPELLYQLLRHLVENAVKFSDRRAAVRESIRLRGYGPGSGYRRADGPQGVERSRNWHDRGSLAQGTRARLIRRDATRARARRNRGIRGSTRGRDRRHPHDPRHESGVPPRLM